MLADTVCFTCKLLTSDGEACLTCELVPGHRPDQERTESERPFVEERCADLMVEGDLFSG